MKWRVIAACFLAFAVTANCREAPPVQMEAVVSIFSGTTVQHASSHATAFFVSADGKLVSTRHAIKDKAEAFIQLNNGKILAISGILAEDPLHDLVLLQVSGTGFPCLQLSAFDQIHENAQARLIIDPYTAQKVKSGHPQPAIPDSRIISGTVATIQNLEDDYQWFTVRVPVRAGESGSPILGETGGVIGMVRAGKRDDTNTCYAVSADYIKQLLSVSAGSSVIKPLSQMQKREFDEIFDEPDFKAGFNAMNQLKFHEALPRLELAVKRFPESGAFHVLLGNCLEQLSRHEEAIREFRKAIEIKSGNAKAWASLGMPLFYLGKNDEAAAACDRAVELKSGSPDTWLNAGETYVCLKQYDKARALLQRLRDGKTPEADESAEKLSLLLQMENALQQTKP